jgi:MraZ protein
MFLTGTFRRSVDEKQRVSIPKRLRTALAESESPTFYLAPGTDGSLAVYSERAFTRLAGLLAEASPTGQDVRAFGRLFYARAHLVEMDAQGRIGVPQELVRLADLGNEVMLVGVGDHIEIWNVDRWNQYLEHKQANYDEIAEKAFGKS